VATGGDFFMATGIAVLLVITGFIIAGAGYGLCNENADQIAGCGTANSIAFAGPIIAFPALATLMAVVLGGWKPIVIASSLGIAGQLGALVYLTTLT